MNVVILQGREDVAFWVWYLFYCFCPLKYLPQTGFHFDLLHFLSSGHGPFSHLFDGKFIPHVCPNSKWKVKTETLRIIVYYLSTLQP